MHVRELELRQFRNLTEQHFVFHERFNVFFGPNAQGKTNILEAINLFATGRSFRTTNIRDMIHYTSNEALVEALVVGRCGEDAWRILLSDEGKSILKNGKGISSRARRGVASIVFTPEETDLFKESPSGRRRYLDHVIANFIPSHTSTLRSYEHIVAQRNRLLIDMNISRSARLAALPDWDAQLVTTGTKVVTTRAEWIERLSRELTKQYAFLAEEDGEALLTYAPFCGREALENMDTLQRGFQHLLGKRRDDELMRKMTLVGPHRDDCIASLSGHELSLYGSQGQHRSFVLALKIAERTLHETFHGEPPLFLLDDVASELDDRRHQFLFHHLAETPGQVFVTTTDRETSPVVKNPETAYFSIQGGKVIL